MCLYRLWVHDKILPGNTLLYILTGNKLFVDSATSSNSDTEITCLHAGVCLTQTTVDAIDSSIAVKAFEIMILCLCARQELIGLYISLFFVAVFTLLQLSLSS